MEPINQSETSSRRGVIGFFEDPHLLVAATRKAREAQLPVRDTFTPYPVHGLEEAQGLKRSILPFITLGGGMTGCLAGFSLQYWTSVVDWPLNVGGKPLNSWPAFVPVMFECTILFAGLATVAGMFILNRLPSFDPGPIDLSITRDRFALWIGEEGEKQQEEEWMQFLQKQGASEVRKLCVD